MKILIITTQIPFPPYRGDKLKIYNISKQLMLNNEVMILTLYRHKSDMEYVAELKKRGINIEVIYHPTYKLVLNSFRSFLNKYPLQVSCFYSSKLKKKISEHLSKYEYDVVYYHLINTVQFYTQIKGKQSLNVIDFTDCMSLYLTRYIKFIKNPFIKIVYKFELKKMLEYESKARLFDILFICSPQDKKFLEDRYIHNNIQLLLNGCDVDEFKKTNIEKEKGRIIFSGNISYFPNKDAIIYFVKEIFPIIIQEVPYAKFYVVGQNPPEEIKKLSTNNVIVTGFVKDIKKEYLLSEVNIAPIRVATGTPNKIIEALILGIPTVATSISAGGFIDDIKKFTYIADTPKEFATKIISILKKGSDYNMELASDIVKKKLSWNTIVSHFEKVLLENLKRN